MEPIVVVKIIVMMSLMMRMMMMKTIVLMKPVICVVMFQSQRQNLLTHLAAVSNLPRQELEDAVDAAVSGLSLYFFFINPTGNMRLPVVVLLNVFHRHEIMQQCC